MLAERCSAGGAGAEEPSVAVGRRVYVNNLSYDTDWKSLKDHFKTVGAVNYAEVLMVGVTEGAIRVYSHRPK